MSPNSQPSPISDARLRASLQAIESGLIERAEAARFLLVAAFSGEHLLLIGQPGTAKSELARRLHRVFGGQYFERLLTRFSVPEELFGPLSLNALDAGRYERDISGYLPTATIAFLDEVFKANSAILNALLTLLNEREFDQGAERIAVPLVSLVAASNELPDDDTLRAFEDRFLLRARVEPVSDEQFAALLGADVAPKVFDTLVSADELTRFRQSARAVTVEAQILAALGDLRVRLRDMQIHVSDRRWVRAVAMLRVSARLQSRDTVTADDLWLLKGLVGEHEQAAEAIANWFCEHFGAEHVIQAQWAQRVVQAFEQQLEREASATELAFDDSGKLALMKKASGADDATLQSAAPRMSAFSKRKRYSGSHIRARMSQIDAMLERFDTFIAGGDAHRRELDARLTQSFLIPPHLASRLHTTLADSLAKVEALRGALASLHDRYAGLPLDDDADGAIPDPIAIPEPQ